MSDEEVAAVIAHAEAQAAYARMQESEWRAVAEAFERVANRRKEEAHGNEAQAH